LKSAMLTPLRNLFASFIVAKYLTCAEKLTK
jgi:hypothetical protein